MKNLQKIKWLNCNAVNQPIKVVVGKRFERLKSETRQIYSLLPLANLDIPPIANAIRR